MQLAELEARIRIHDRFARYMRAIDSYDETLLFACFTENGVLETPVLGGTFVGREGQREFVNRARKAGEAQQMRHLFTNLEVELEDDRASARAYLVVNTTKDGKTTIFHTGHYECRLRKVGEDWLFEYRKVFIDGSP